MLGLVIIDMQRWMFRYPERAAQIPLLVGNVNALANAFNETGLPIFDVRTIHKADRSTWSRLMRKHDYPCLLEGTEDAELVDGYRSLERAVQITKTANSVFVGTDFETVLKAAGVAELVLTGVFIDGCVGLTAADAAQRGLEVTFVEDAIGHTRSDRRGIILNWLAADYELKLQMTEQVLARVLGRPL
jgi:nicotinamidase-related amidase